ncbi:MAG: carbonic anhydrase [Candidatus Aquicultorales bacterium]
MRESVRSPAKAFQLLSEGNRRFVEGKPAPADLPAKRLELTDGQSPYAAIVSCADSRVPPEAIFDAGLGDLFVVRAAGGLLDELGLATVDFVVEYFPARLIAVIGHEGCGAVEATAEGRQGRGRVSEIIDRLSPFTEDAKAAGMSGNQLTEWVARTSVLHSVDTLTHSPVLEEKLGTGELAIVGGFYKLASGKVEWITPTP